MTAWGFADCQRDPNGYGFGSTLGRLFLRTLPNDYSMDSIYTWFPLMQPESMKGYLEKLGKLDGYSVAQPQSQVPPATVDNYADIRQLLRSSDKFVPEYVERAAEVIKGKGYAGVTTALVDAYSSYSFFAASVNGTEEQKQFIGALAPSSEAVSKICSYFYNDTSELIKETSFSLVGDKTRGVNIVRDVLKFVPLRWAATQVVRLHLMDVDVLFHGDFEYRLALRSRLRKTPTVNSPSLSCSICFPRFTSQSRYAPFYSRLTPLQGSSSLKLSQRSICC